MKIIIIPDNPTIHGRRYLIAQALANKGHEVHYIVWDNPFHMGRKELMRHLFTSTFRKQFSYKELTVHKFGRLPLYWPYINGMLFKLQLKRLFHRLGADIVITESYTNETEVPKSLPFIYDIADDYAAPADVYGTRMYKLAFKLLGVRSTMKRQCQNARAVTVLSEILYKFAKQYNDKTIKLPDGVEKNNIEEALNDPSTYSTNEQSIVYVSGFGKWSRPIETMQVVKDFRNDFPSIDLTMIGGSTEAEKIKEFIKKNHAESYIHYLGPVFDRKKVFTAINQSAIGLNISDKNKWRDAAHPIKVLEYSAMGKKVVSTNLAEVEALDFPNIFKFSDSGNEADFRSAMRSALDYKNRKDEYTEVSSHVLNEYDWEKLVGRLVDLINYIKYDNNHTDRPQKLLFITQEFSKTGGAGVYAYELVRSLSKLGVEVHVMCLNTRSFDEHIDPLVTVHWHKVISLPLLRVPTHHLQVLRKSKKIINTYRITSIHSNNYAGAFARGNIPMLATIHHPALEEVKHASRLQRPIYQFDRYFEKKVISRAMRIVVPSHLVEKLLAEYVPREKLVVLADGIDLESFSTRPGPSTRTKYIKNDKETLIFFPTGARAKRKGALDLLVALQGINQPYRCIVSGNMDVDLGWRSELESALAKSGQADKFDFLGLVDFEKMPQYYSAADIVVYPSTFEGFGLPVLEALACGKPLICTNTGEIPYIVKDGHNGLLAKVGDIYQLRSCLERLMQSKSERERLAGNARKSVLGYTWESIASKTMQLHVHAAGEHQ